MKEYKVIIINLRDNVIRDGEYRWNIINYDVRACQENVLNYYGAKGWKLVSVVSRNDDYPWEMFMYLER